MRGVIGQNVPPCLRFPDACAALGGGGGCQGSCRFNPVAQILFGRGSEVPAMAARSWRHVGVGMGLGWAGERSAARVALRAVSLRRGPDQGRTSSLRCGRSTLTGPAAAGAWLRAKRPTDRGWPPSHGLCWYSTKVARGCSLPPSQGGPGASIAGERRGGAHAACARGCALAPAGLSVTGPGGVQSRVAPLQRSGRAARACA